ncbi:sensor histidine kinase [Bacillus alkalicellulosilyticus]|uniref:sensor histidine kinase n=1 Tax=Alkalihalobacterium alkalicellulosilyticum TaxID=1912214 RepID=UPI000998D7CD|nr:sensor histidine kinase [Bacillus alkalicellulosilyticus]
MPVKTKLMIPIRAKLMLFFIVLFFIMISLSLFISYNYSQTVQHYNHIQERFFLLNDVSQKSSKTYETMDAYLNKNQSSDLQSYKHNRDQLIDAKNLLVSHFQNENNYIQTRNYQYMIDSFIEETDVAISSFHEDDIEVYSESQKEAFMLIGFIQDQTLTLLNDDLSMFQTYYDALNQRNEDVKLTLFFMSFATFSVGVFTTYLFSNSISAPINQLTKTAREVAAGKLDGPKLTETSDEIGFLSKTFNKMRTDLAFHVRQLHEKSEQDKLVKEMELKSLQSQINPHFLFNTLNTISKCALIEGSETIFKLINSISKLLRYNLGVMDKPVTLADEISVVQEYFYIQKARFEERVEFSVDITEDCLSLRMPILTLQPLVENAFIHGIEPYEQKGKIEIVGHCEGNYVVLQIKDNGIGMDNRTSQMLLDKSVTTSSLTGHSTGLGVKNVLRRLELFYQSHERISIDTEVGKGTTIQLKLPKQGMEGNSYV